MAQAKGMSAKVLKVMGLFSGLQSFSIICSIVKMKLVALWLHAAGVGLFGIYTSAIDTVSTLTDLGLRQSGVREVAQGAKNGRLAVVMALVRRWSRWIGLMGGGIMVALSPWLSQWMFGDFGHWWGFAVLAVAMLFNAIVNGEQSILQGTERLRKLASIGFNSSLWGLLISVPMFRWLGQDSVALSFIAYSGAALVAALVRRPKPDKEVRLSARETLRQGAEMARLGAYMGIAAFVTSLVQLAFFAWLNREADTSTVGLVQAGNALVVRYVGMIFSAVAMEYYPRLSANAFSKRRLHVFVNHEMQLLLLVLIPVMLLFLMLREPVVRLLYSSEFYGVIPFISWAILGNIFRAGSTCVAYTILAKGEGKTYLCTESADAVIGLALNIILFHNFGMAGLGVAYILWYLSYLVMVCTVARVRYGIRISRTSWLAMLLSCVAGAGALAAVQLLPVWAAVVILSASTIASAVPVIRFVRSH